MNPLYRREFLALGGALLLARASAQEPAPTPPCSLLFPATCPLALARAPEGLVVVLAAVLEVAYRPRDDARELRVHRQVWEVRHHRADQLHAEGSASVGALVGAR